MNVAEIIAAIYEWAPRELSCEWDRDGLSVGDPAQEVTKVVVALTPTRSVLETAVKRGAQMVVTHHPLIWDPLKNLRTDAPNTRLCADFLKAGLACFAAHTNLDIAPGGINDLLAGRLGLTNCRPLLPSPNEQVKLVTFVPDSHVDAVRDALCDAGAGIIGGYTFCTFSSPGTCTYIPGAGTNPFAGAKNVLNKEPERRLETLVGRHRLTAVLEALKKAHPYEQPAYDIIPVLNRDPGIGLGLVGELPAPVSLGTLASAVKRDLALDHARVCGYLRGKVRTVAVLGGAGGGEAARFGPGIDVYITGDIKYHDALLALECGISLIDAGHAGTEKLVVPVMAGYLKKRFNKLGVVACNEPEIFQIVK